MTTVIAHNTLGYARRAGGVQNVKRIGRSDGHTAGRFCTGHRLNPIDVTAGDECCFDLWSLQDDATLRLVPRQGDRLIKHRLVWDHSINFNAAGCRDYEFRTRV